MIRKVVQFKLRLSVMRILNSLKQTVAGILDRREKTKKLIIKTRLCCRIVSRPLVPEVFITSSSASRILPKNYLRYSINFLLTNSGVYVLTGLNVLVMKSNIIVINKTKCVYLLG